MNRLHDQEGVAAKGLEFKILTTTRTAEVIGAKWNEIDFDQAIWTIPADRMKNGTEHRVPLSGAVVSILNQIRTVRVSDYVFPGGKKNSPLSNMAFNQLLKRMNISKDVAVPHGFRSTFRDWAAERTGVQNEVAEMALAHSVSSKVEAAYRRGDLFDKRRRLMDAWAEYCSTPAPTGASVVSLRGADNG